MKKIIAFMVAFAMSKSALASQVMVIQDQQKNKEQHENKTLGALNAAAYASKAKYIIAQTLSLNQGLPSDQKTFLNEMTTNGQKLENGILNVKQATKALDVQWVWFFVMNRISTDNGARFYWEFVRASNELMSHSVRRHLKCYITSLEDFEQSYADEMQEVNEEEFNQKLKTVDAATIDRMLIQEASSLAHAVNKDLEHAQVIVNKLLKDYYK